MPLPLSTTANYPGTHWNDLKILCDRVDEEADKELILTHGGRSRWGDGTRWKCSVGTLIIDSEIAPCTPCQKIEYTCRNTGAQVHQKTFCPVGAKYPDRRLDLLGHKIPATCSEEDEITVPKKSCPQIRRDTIRFISALWQKDCDIKTNGELRDLLNEAGPHCGTVRYSCPTADGQPQSKEWNYCARQIGNWELSMRQFLMGLSPSCMAEGPGKTALWWRYYQHVLMKTNPEAVYGVDVTWGKEADTLVTDVTFLREYRYQKNGRKIDRKPPDLVTVKQPVFYRNSALPAWSKSWVQQTVGSALAAVCSSVDIQGSYDNNPSDAVQTWFSAAEDRGMETMICPLPELGVVTLIR